MKEPLFIVVPAYNEATQIGSVVRSLTERFANVVVIDDGSTDATGQAAAAAGAVVLRHAINRGQGAAIQTGISYSLVHGAAYIVTFDSDGQHQPADVTALVEAVASGNADVALGSRFLGSAVGMPGPRRVMLRVATQLTRLTTGVRVTDTHNGLRCFSRIAAQQIQIRLDRMAHASELLDQITRAHLRITEVPVHIVYTDYSTTKGQRMSGALRIVFDYVIGRLLK